MLGGAPAASTTCRAVLTSATGSRPPFDSGSLTHGIPANELGIKDLLDWLSCLLAPTEAVDSIPLPGERE